MRINANVLIDGQNVKLIPYRRNHVLKYHEWMQSKELQELTASEPLSLDEEYQMQNSWFEDENKCTFIILDKKLHEESGDEVVSMIGDTNLFLIPGDTKLAESEAEAEIMIAEQKARGKHFGKEAIILMLLYGHRELSINRYQVKIGVDNLKSINLFKSLGFVEVGVSTVFREVTMCKNVDENWVNSLENRTKYSLKSYECDG